MINVSLIVYKIIPFFRLKSEISQLGLFKNIVSKAKQANNHHHQQSNGYGGEQHSFYSQPQRQYHVQQQHQQQEEEGEEEGEDGFEEGDGDVVLVSPDMCSVSIDD